MKLCSSHFHDLNHAIRQKGMGRLINSDRTKEFARRWMEGTATESEFDPLVVANLEINAKVGQIGLIVLNGSCPLCEVNRGLMDVTAADKWIDNVSDLMLLTAKVNRLVA